MDSKTKFFEYPLERECYVAKSPKVQKKPIRILITAGGSKIASNLTYMICSDEAFGEDQPIILKLHNTSRRFVSQTLISEIVHCGFRCLMDITASREAAYEEIDVIILIAQGENRSGFSYGENVTHCIMKFAYFGSCIRDMPDVKDLKIIVTGASTKLCLYAMYIIKHFAPEISNENLSCVTMLDEAIARSHLASKLKVTTDRIKNVYIWGNTCPDVHNATVLTYPPGDRGALEMVEIPVADVLKNDRWLKDDFVDIIYKRVIDPSLNTYGKAVAQATVRHITALFRGTAPGEIVSMGILAPGGNSYLIPERSPFSFPVTAANGKWKLVENVELDFRTILLILQMIHTFETDAFLNIRQILDCMQKIDHDEMVLDQDGTVGTILKFRNENSKYLLTPVPLEVPAEHSPCAKGKRSVIWLDKLTADSSLCLQKSHSQRTSFSSNASMTTDPCQPCRPCYLVKENRFEAEEQDEQVDVRSDSYLERQKSHSCPDVPYLTDTSGQKTPTSEKAEIPVLRRDTTTSCHIYKPKPEKKKYE